MTLKGSSYRNKINMKPIKAFAFEKIPETWILREILLCEDDQLNVEVFLARLPIWLRLTKPVEKSKEVNHGGN
jgi:hypothetical protein